MNKFYKIEETIKKNEGAMIMKTNEELAENYKWKIQEPQNFIQNPKFIKQVILGDLQSVQ